jgi:hypothetical protein
MSRSNFSHLKHKAEKLRTIGKTYSEINISLGVRIPKSTLSLWFRDLKLSRRLSLRLKLRQNLKIKKGRKSALRVTRENRKLYMANLLERNKHLLDLLKSRDIAKIVLITLYLGEGSKSPKHGSLTFGNSDPRIIRLFLKLFRKCYKIDETKLRCTVQCRADQDTNKLEQFWQKITKIPLNKFYGARIDPRTIGQKSRNPEYKGVCRIDYFSAEVLNDILKAIEIIAGR